MLLKMAVTVDRNENELNYVIIMRGVRGPNKLAKDPNYGNPDLIAVANLLAYEVIVNLVDTLICR